MLELRHNFDGPTPGAIRRLEPVLKAMQAYHRHEVVGIDHIPVTGPALLVIHHSFATYDAILLGAAIGLQRGRWAASLGDDKLFAFPGLRRLSSRTGVVPASPENGLRLLAQGHLVCVAPGGMREALRPSTEKRSVRWKKRKGFVRLALQAGVPLVPAACPAADEIYTVYENALTKQVYRAFRLPLPIARGLGPTVIPRPVKLVHHVGRPITPPSPETGDFEARVDAVHQQVVAAVEGLLAR